jgi:formyl-CoA transferase
MYSSRTLDPARSSGLASTTRRCGRYGPTVADTGTGLHLAIGILAALYQRSRTGHGQRVQVAMQEAVINYTRIAYARQMMSGEAASRYGVEMALKTAPAGMFPCAPGGPNDYCFIYGSRAHNEHWRRLLDAIGRSDLADEPRFASPELRAERSPEIQAIVSDWTSSRTKREVMETLGRIGVPAGAVFDTMELSNDPHLRANGTFVNVVHPEHGEFIMPGFPVRMSDSSVKVTAAPLLGAHNCEVYSELLGITEAEQQRLKEAGVI